MQPEKRRVKGSKKGILFYQISTCIFFFMLALSFIYCCMYGFTDTRVVLILMNGWFALFTMNMMTERFKRADEKQLVRVENIPKAKRVKL
jgi:L-asparagine transporter-like permease